MKIIKLNSHIDESVDEVIRDVISQMRETPADTKEYSELVKNLDILCKARSHTREGRASMDTILTVFGSLASIGMILSYEQTHVVASKALSFVLKARV